MSDGIAPPSISVWRPHKSFGYPQGTHGQMRNPTCILDHIMEGWKATLDSRWADDHGVGVHWGIARDGDASQYTNLFDASWGQGVSGRRDLYNPQNNRHLKNWEDSNGARWVRVPYAGTQAMALIDERGVSIPNSRAPSKEHEGFHGDRWDARMIKRSAEIDEWIMQEFWRVKRWEMTVDKDLKIGHHEIDGVNRVNCPGADWRNRVEGVILEILKPATPKPPEEWMPTEAEWTRLEEMIDKSVKRNTDSTRMIVRLKGMPHVYHLDRAMGRLVHDVNMTAFLAGGGDFDDLVTLDWNNPDHAEIGRLAILYPSGLRDLEAQFKPKS